jgi:hypothetical protein
MTAARTTADLHAELATVYQRLAEVSRELADEQALTRRLRTVIALTPFQARPPPRRRAAPPATPPRGLVPLWPPPRRNA